MFTPRNTYFALLVVQALHLLHHRLTKRHISFAEVISGMVLCVPWWLPIPALLIIGTHITLIAVQIRDSGASVAGSNATEYYLSAEGYRPTNIKLRRGVRARLTFIRKSAEGCGTEIVIPSYGINRPLPQDVPVVVVFTPIKSVRVKLTCGMDKFRGSLVVR